MYSTCIFCHTQLGRNESLEHFPVGRRIAYDMVTGRLWVICKACKRWNLSPIESRWEALEDAERAFRGTRLRVETDNIALAQLREGLELVRIGKPPRLELAAWRYGNQFARRWRKHAALSAATSGALALYVGASFGPLLLPSLAQFTIVGSATLIAYQGVTIGTVLRDRMKVRFHVRDERGRVLGLTRTNAAESRLQSDPKIGDWWLRLPFRSVAGRSYEEGESGTVDLRGDKALRALATMLPYLNRAGARERDVRDAIEVIDSNESIRGLFTQATKSPQWRYAGVKLITNQNHVGALPPRLRLAMEMVLHEENERRALEGELEELLDQWRDAEEIGKIADGLV